MEAKRLNELFSELWSTKIKPRFAKTQHLNAKHSVDLLAKITRESLLSCPFRERLGLHDDVKDNREAAKLRTEGNKMFHPNVKRYIEAIKLYNQAITVSQKGSEERALAYDNRSIICLEMQRYEECLENIRLARESNYPERLKGKLDERETSAKQALAKMADKKATSRKDSSGEVEELQLSYPSHENAPQIANCLELQKNDQYGRHVVTNRKLNVGDVVMIDKPFVTVLEEQLRHVRCDFCHAERLFTLIPCEGCSAVMYCSEECWSKAYKKYHLYECAVLRYMCKIVSELSTKALRAAATTIAIFDNDPEALREHLDYLDVGNVNAFTMDWRKATQKGIYNMLHVFTAVQEINISYLVPPIFHSSIIHILLLENKMLGTISKLKPEYADMIFNLIMLFLLAKKQTLYMNEFNKETGLYDLKLLARGSYPLVNLLNHSCAPNVVNIYSRDGRCAIVVIKPISGGDQLFTTDNGQNFLTQSRKERQECLLQLPMLLKSIFQCTCEACVSNYPTYDDMISAADADVRKEAVILELQCSVLSRNGDKRKILEFMAHLRSQLNDAASCYPNALFSARQTKLIHFYTLLYNQKSDNLDYWKYCNA